MEAQQLGLISLQSRTFVRLGDGAPQNVVEGLVPMTFHVPVLCAAFHFFTPDQMELCLYAPLPPRYFVGIVGFTTLTLRLF
jgi:hypothetical protein